MTAQKILRWRRVEFYFWILTGLAACSMLYFFARAIHKDPHGMPPEAFYGLGFMIIAAAFCLSAADLHGSYASEAKLIKRWNGEYYGTVNNFPLDRERRNELKPWTERELFACLGASVKGFENREQAEEKLRVFEKANLKPTLAGVAAKYRERTSRAIIGPSTIKNELETELRDEQTEYDKNASELGCYLASVKKSAEKQWRYAQRQYDLFRDMDMLPNDPSTGKPYDDLTKLLEDRKKELASPPQQSIPPGEEKIEPTGARGGKK